MFHCNNSVDVGRQFDVRCTHTRNFTRTEPMIYVSHYNFLSLLLCSRDIYPEKESPGLSFSEKKKLIRYQTHVRHCTLELRTAK